MDCYLTLIILSNINNNASKRLNSSFWSVDGTQTGNTTPNQNGTESNGNEGVLHIPQTPRLDAVKCHAKDTKWFHILLRRTILFNIIHSYTVE